ncbi:hypothetical protein GCM10009129_09600 [Psychrobacter aestuarii]|uniref:Uncharacterized protein n=1 Tax=Psychrobacter aestuarii TaxID=556327 RepID=A0ABN0VQ18_9GAMM
MVMRVRDYSNKKRASITMRITVSSIDGIRKPVVLVFRRTQRPEFGAIDGFVQNLA